nr:hypothetical protein CFP56_22015 [Quercus suber]
MATWMMQITFAEFRKQQPRGWKPRDTSIGGTLGMDVLDFEYQDDIIQYLTYTVLCNQIPLTSLCGSGEYISCFKLEAERFGGIDIVLSAGW